MFLLETSDYDIYNEYLRCKYKNKSIKVIREEQTNTTHTTIVIFRSIDYSPTGDGYTFKKDVINYNELWIIVRKLKLKKLKDKICQTRLI